MIIIRIRKGNDLAFHNFLIFLNKLIHSDIFDHLLNIIFQDNSFMLDFSTCTVVQFSHFFVLYFALVPLFAFLQIFHSCIFNINLDILHGLFSLPVLCSFRIFAIFFLFVQACHSLEKTIFHLLSHKLCINILFTAIFFKRLITFF